MPLLQGGGSSERLSHNSGSHGGPANKDCSILGSILGPPYSGTLPCGLSGRIVAGKAFRKLFSPPNIKPLISNIPIMWYIIRYWECLILGGVGGV